MEYIPLAFFISALVLRAPHLSDVDSYMWSLFLSLMGFIFFFISVFQ